MEYIDLDMESGNREVDLPDVGPHAYAIHPQTILFLFRYSIHPDPTVKEWILGQPLPADLIDAIARGVPLVAHNREFEATMWNEYVVPRWNVPRVPIDGGVCTAARAAAMALPRSLDAVCAVRGYPVRKDGEGSKLMMQMAKNCYEPIPRGFKLPPEFQFKKGDVVVNEHTLRRLSAYCATDVVCENQILNDPWVYALNETEYRVWQLDQRINARGAYIDGDSVNGCIAVYEEAMRRGLAQLHAMTGGMVETAGQHARVLAFAKSRFNYSMDGSDKKARAKAMEDPNCPQELKALFKLIGQLNKSSCSKFYRMRQARCPDGRVRNLMMYCGAGRTGRWTSRLIQLQNLPGQTLDPDVIAHILTLARAHDLRSIELIYGSPIELLSQCIRGCITAAPGMELLDADFNAIEARGLAWLAGEQWRIDFFNTPESEWPMVHGKRKRPDIYIKSYSETFGIPYEDVTDKQRKVGKVEELALGYEGGDNAMLNFGADKLGMDEAQRRDVKNKWRAANPNITAFWAILKEAAVNAIQNPGYAYHAGKYITFFMYGPYLHMRLPSGRLLSYYNPTAEYECNQWGKWDYVIKFWGRQGSASGDEEGKWTQISTHGGKLCNNATQGTCRDKLASAQLRADDNGYPIIFHVHDELITEDWIGKRRVSDFEQLMSLPDAWAPGFPVRAAGWVGDRFRKD